jgi:hypothetical protein
MNILCQVQTFLSQEIFRIRHMFILKFFSKWLLLSTPRISTFPPRSPCIITKPTITSSTRIIVLKSVVKSPCGQLVPSFF